MFVLNGFTINAQLTVGIQTGSGRVHFDGSQTLGGTGSVIFGNSSTTNSLLNRNSGDDLTIGPNMTALGNIAYLGYSPTVGRAQTGSIINQGTVRADVASGVIYFNEGGGVALISIRTFGSLNHSPFEVN